MERCSLAEENNMLEEKLKIELLVERVEKWKSSVEKKFKEALWERGQRKKRLEINLQMAFRPI